jgi:TetR/AcrR family transcriptional regulator
MDNRTNILSIALGLFSNSGYESVGIQEIVDKAEITKPTLYHYFGSKRGLLNALLEEYFRELLDSVKQASDYRGDLTKSLSDVTKAFFEYVQKNKDFYRLQLSMCFSSPQSESYDAVSDYNEKLFKMMENMFIKASEDHGNMRNRHKRYAFTFIGMINNYITLYLRNHITLDDESVYLAVKQFSHGIYS